MPAKFHSIPGQIPLGVEMVQRAATFADLAGGIRQAFGITGDIMERATRARIADMALQSFRAAEPGSLQGFIAAAALSKFGRGNAADDAEVSAEEYREANSAMQQGASAAVRALSGVGMKALEAIPAGTADDLRKAASAISSARDKISEVRRMVRYELREEIEDAEDSATRLPERRAYLDSRRAIEDRLFSFARSDEYESIPYMQRQRALNAERKRLYKEFSGPAEAYQKKRDELMEAVERRIQERIDAETAAERAEIERLEAQREQLRKIVDESVRGALLSESPVSEEDARAWVESNVHIDQKAMNRLKRSGGHYTTRKQVEADMAEFYRLVGGKVARIVLTSAGTTRAHASNATGEIAVDSRFTKQTLFHEMAHHVEHDMPFLNEAAAAWRDSQSEDGKLYSLSSLTGNRRYGSDEVARKGAYFHPYVGKVYRHGSTEVVSMGLQQLADADHILELVEKSPEHLAFAIGAIKQNDPVTMAAVEAKQAMLAGDVKKAASAEDFDSALKKVATAKATKKYEIANMDEKPGMIGILKTRGRGGLVRMPREDINEKATGQVFRSIQEARNFVYLYETFGNQYDISYYSTWALSGTKAPEWFDPDKGLPKLNGGEN
jgi:hypothetical protein